MWFNDFTVHFRTSVCQTINDMLIGDTVHSLFRAIAGSIVAYRISSSVPEELAKVSPEGEQILLLPIN